MPLGSLKRRGIGKADRLPTTTDFGVVLLKKGNEKLNELATLLVQDW